MYSIYQPRSWQCLAKPCYLTMPYKFAIQIRCEQSLNEQGCLSISIYKNNLYIHIIYIFICKTPGWELRPNQSFLGCSCRITPHPKAAVPACHVVLPSRSVPNHSSKPDTAISVSSVGLSLETQSRCSDMSLCISIENWLVNILGHLPKYWFISNAHLQFPHAKYDSIGFHLIRKTLTATIRFHVRTNDAHRHQLQQDGLKNHNRNLNWWIVNN